MELKFKANNPARSFSVGLNQEIDMHDIGLMQLEPNEQITLETESGSQYDIARKSWGFYATPSINSRLLNFNLQTALVKNNLERFYIMLVEENKKELFNQYLSEEKLTLVCWMHDQDTLDIIQKSIENMR